MSPFCSTCMTRIMASFINFIYFFSLTGSLTRYRFHQNTDLLYLTGFQEPDAVLVMESTSLPDFRTVLYVRPRDPFRYANNHCGSCNSWSPHVEYFLACLTVIKTLLISLLLATASRPVFHTEDGIPTPKFKLSPSSFAYSPIFIVLHFPSQNRSRSPPRYI